jgi:hypothetical protein
MNFKKYMTFDMPCTNYNTVYSDNLLIFTCDYPKSIEGLSYNMSINFDPALFKGTSLDLVIPASGMNAKLTYD